MQLRSIPYPAPKQQQPALVAPREQVQLKPAPPAHKQQQPAAVPPREQVQLKPVASKPRLDPPAAAATVSQKPRPARPEPKPKPEPKPDPPAVATLVPRQPAAPLAKLKLFTLGRKVLGVCKNQNQLFCHLVGMGQP